MYQKVTKTVPSSMTGSNFSSEIARSGRCHAATMTPSASVAAKGVRRYCMRGNAKPRQPGSSPSGANTGTTSRSTNNITSADTSRLANAASDAPNTTLTPPAANPTASGTSSAAT